MLEVDEAHIRDAEGILCAGDVDARLAVKVRVLGNILARAIIHEVKAVDAEAHEFDRADAWVAFTLDHEGSASCLIIGVRLQIDEDAAAARP